MYYSKEEYTYFYWKCHYDFFYALIALYNENKIEFHSMDIGDKCQVLMPKGINVFIEDGIVINVP